MIEILLLAMLVMAAKRKGSGRRSFNLRRVRISSELALVTLASDIALTGSLTGVAGGAYRAVTMKMTFTLRNATEGEGPVTVGYAHSDYSVTEIKECLEAFAAIDQGDKIARERANRLVRTVGTMWRTGGVTGAVGSASLNDGKPIRTKLNWLINIGDSVNLFVFNESTGALTTGAFINIQGDMWIKDST